MSPRGPRRPTCDVCKCGQLDIDRTAVRDGAWHKLMCPVLIRETAIDDELVMTEVMRQYDPTRDYLEKRREWANDPKNGESERAFSKAVADEIERLRKTGEIDKMKCLRCSEIEAIKQETPDASAKLVGVTGRHELAHTFAEWLESVKLAPSRECVVERDAGKKHYRICWSNGDIGGEVRLFGPTWIQVTWDGDVEYMPMRGNRVFEIDMTAQEFMTAAFVDGNWESAQTVPVKAES